MVVWQYPRVSRTQCLLFNKNFVRRNLLSFIAFVIIVLFCMGRNISLRSFLSVAHLFHKPQMPPRRDPDDSNNNDQESRTEAMMQQMMAAQTQLMTVMA